MQTGYGFVYPRGTALSPAAEAFMAEVRGVEAEIAAAEKQAGGTPPCRIAGAAQALAAPLIRDRRRNDGDAARPKPRALSLPP